MIAVHQPTIFGKNVIAGFSSRNDGTMLDRSIGRHAPEIIKNRGKFVENIKIYYQDVVYQIISYQDNAPYNSLAIVDGRHTVDNSEGVIADALITNQTNVALFLPVADCVAVALFDPRNKVIANLHLGRHSTVTDLVSRVILTMTSCYKTNPADVLAYLSPSAQVKSYGLDYFEQVDDPDWQDFIEKRDNKIFINMPGYNKEHLIRAGLKPENIEDSGIDVYANQDYFSHSRGDIHGRMALVTMMAAD
jgi:copper oxidase (laccase) domain-containing protein